LTKQTGSPEHAERPAPPKPTGSSGPVRIGVASVGATRLVSPDGRPGVVRPDNLPASRPGPRRAPRPAPSATSPPPSGAMDPARRLWAALDLVGLPSLMAITRGSPRIRLALIDGPVADHPHLDGTRIDHLTDGSAAHQRSTGLARQHATAIAGLLAATPESGLPAICPGCRLLVRPIFREDGSGNALASTPDDLAQALVDTVDAGVNVINLSAALIRSYRGVRTLELALDHAAAHRTIVVAAAGNQASFGGSTITRHPWVIPVVAYTLSGVPMDQSVIAPAVGRRGLGACGEKLPGLGTTRASVIGGTSAATPFVAGAIGLLWSIFPGASAEALRYAVGRPGAPRRSAVMPPLLDAWTVYQSMLGSRTDKEGSS
jgi:Subtilase family